MELAAEFSIACGLLIFLRHGFFDTDHNPPKTVVQSISSALTRVARDGLGCSASVTELVCGSTVAVTELTEASLLSLLAPVRAANSAQHVSPGHAVFPPLRIVGFTSQTSLGLRPPEDSRFSRRM